MDFGVCVKWNVYVHVYVCVSVCACLMVQKETFAFVCAMRLIDCKLHRVLFQLKTRSYRPE